MREIIIVIVIVIEQGVTPGRFRSQESEVRIKKTFSRKDAKTQRKRRKTRLPQRRGGAEGKDQWLATKITKNTKKTKGDREWRGEVREFLLSIPVQMPITITITSTSTSTSTSVGSVQ